MSDIIILDGKEEAEQYTVKVKKRGRRSKKVNKNSDEEDTFDDYFFSSTSSPKKKKVKAKPKLLKNVKIEKKDDFFDFGGNDEGKVNDLSELDSIKESKNENLSTPVNKTSKTEAELAIVEIEDMTPEVRKTRTLKHQPARERSLTPPPNVIEENDDEILFIETKSASKTSVITLNEESVIDLNSDLDYGLVAEVVAKNETKPKPITKVEIEMRPFINNRNVVPRKSMKFTQKSNETLGAVMRLFADNVSLPLDSLVFLYNDVSVSYYNTPAGLNLNEKCVVDVVTKDYFENYFQGSLLADEPLPYDDNPQQDNSESEEETTDSFSISLNTRGEKVSVRVSPKTSIFSIAKHFKKLKCLKPETKISFKFDGAVIDQETTVGELDLEEDDQLDLIIQQ